MAQGLSMGQRRPPSGSIVTPELRGGAPRRKSGKEGPAPQAGVPPQRPMGLGHGRGP